MSSNTDDGGVSPQVRSISTFVEAAAAQLRTLDTAPVKNNKNSSVHEEQGALLYFGNWQDPIPRLLILDRTLDASDVRLWAYLRTLFTQPGMPTAFPSYQDIQRDLPMARATLAGCISILRATRWITRCATVRDARGRYKGSIYALHNEPLNLADTLYLDDEYMAFLAKSTQHSYKRIRIIASAVLDTIRDQIGQESDITVPPTVLKQAEHRLLQAQSLHHMNTEANKSLFNCSWSAIGNMQTESLNTKNLITERSETEVIGNANPSSNSELGDSGENLPSSKSELGENGRNPPGSNSKLSKNGENSPSSNSELGKNNNSRASISSGSCSSSFFKKTTTTHNTNIPRAREGQDIDPGELILPSTLKPNERPLVIMQIERIPEENRQDVLDQLTGALNNKNRKEPIRDPVAYLYRLCRCVLSGEFEQTSQGLAVKEQRVRETARARREQEAAEAHDRKVKAHLNSIQQRFKDKGQ